MNLKEFKDKAEVLHNKIKTWRAHIDEAYKELAKLRLTVEKPVEDMFKLAEEADIYVGNYLWAKDFHQDVCLIRIKKIYKGKVVSSAKNIYLTECLFVERTPTERDRLKKCIKAHKDELDEALNGPAYSDHTKASLDDRIACVARNMRTIDRLNERLTELNFKESG